MKRTIFKLKSYALELAFFAAASILVLTLTLPSCNNVKPEDTKDIAQNHNDEKFDNIKKEDAEFLVKAAEINLEEIQLGHLAQTHGTANHIKELGNTIVVEHTKALNYLQALAIQKKISLPITITDIGISANKKLMSTNTSKFDKEFSDIMVKRYKDAIIIFEKVSTDSKDADIQKWATTMLLALRTHLDQSVMCQEECNKM